MSKYAPEELQRMAREALAARDAGDPNWLQLVMALTWRGVDPRTAERLIEELAK